jgi:hypothetical protein
MPQSDAMYALLRDPDLYSLVGRVARKRVGDESFADDVRNGSFEIAMDLIRRAKPPKDGMVRGWMCRITRFHALEELRRRKEEPQPLASDDDPDLPVEDHQTLYEEVVRMEKLFDATELVAANNPEDAARVLDGDGRTKKADAVPKDAAARKRKARSREALAAAITAAVAVAAFFVWLRVAPKPEPQLPAGAYATLADASQELAHQACAASEWVDCLEQLEHMRRLDVTKFGPDEQKAWDTAAAGLRREAAVDLEKNRDPLGCLEKLDTARRYDPNGDLEGTVTLLRTTAQQKLGGAQPQPFRAPDVKLTPPR